MTQTEIILASMAASDGATHTPVQIQKLLFLIDKKLSVELGGPFFNFIAYDYGPFDKEIYRTLESLAIENLVEIIEAEEIRWKRYRLTFEGQRHGKKILNGLDKDVANYIKKLSKFVRDLSFAQLVSSIYHEYPEMRENSVFAHSIFA